MNSISVAAFRDELQKIAFGLKVAPIQKTVNTAVNMGKSALPAHAQASAKMLGTQLSGHGVGGVQNVAKTVTQAKPDAARMQQVKQTVGNSQIGKGGVQSAANPGYKEGLGTRLFNFVSGR